MFTPNKKPSLIRGLKYMIEQVEQLPHDTIFNMEYYPDCVIGQTLFFSQNWEYEEKQVLSKIFGIQVESDKEYGYFSYLSQDEYFTKKQLKVIKLFSTKASGKNEVTKTQWLHDANLVLGELLEKKALKKAKKQQKLDNQ